MHKLFPRVVAIFTILSLAIYPTRTYALPTDGTIVEGTGAINDAVGNNLTVDQSSNKMVANWGSFSIGSPETVRFNQPDASAIALNRVIGGSPSEILGRLTANGRIFLVNPNGVLFGAGSHVDTAGLVASTLNISNTDFMNGNYAFTGAGGAVINAGTLSSPGGFVALLGAQVTNSGAILADLGTVALASGKAITMGLDAQNAISVVINQSTDVNPNAAGAAVVNSGNITADGGKVLLTADVLKGVFAKAINTDGIIEANTLNDVNGQVDLEANDRVNVAGTINAKGGDVTVNSEGANFSGIINAANGVYNMHGGDTYLTGGSYSGNQAWGDDFNVFLNEDITVTNGNVTISADQDNNGSGDLTITAALRQNGGYTVLQGVNIILNGATIENIVPVSTSDTWGWAHIELMARGDLTIINHSSVTARIDAALNGRTEIYMGHDPDEEGNGWTHDISISDSTITSSVTNADDQATSNIEMDLTGSLDIEKSTISSTTTVNDPSGNGGYSNIDINLFGNGEGDGNVTIAGSGETRSTLTAQVNGAGHADITIYNSNPNNDTYWSDLADQYVEGLSDLLDIGSDGSIPINGSVTITNSKLQALAADPNSYDLTDILNNDTNNFGAVVGIMSQGPITLTSSTISAANVNAPAAVGLFSGSSVSIDSNSTVSATTEDSLAGVGIAAMGSDKSGVSIDAAGTISADAGDGVGIVGLLGDGDVNATGTVEASGSLDTIGLLEDLLANNTDYTVDLGLDETIGSAVLIGSINGDVTLGDVSGDLVGVAALGLSDDGRGNIFDAGTVSGKALLLLARHDIGTESEPLNTDVDVVAGYSWDQGDIYLNEANDITLGLYLPSISVSNGDSSSSFDLGISLAAKDGDINVVSGGDMLVNSVIAGNGSVYLTSTEGSISTGHGWDPRLTQDALDQIGSMGSTLAGDLGFKVSSEDISSALGQGLMQDPFFGLTIFGALDNSEYVSPVMFGSPMKYGPNVLALGDSETPVEVVLDAQGGNVVVDDGSIMALNHGDNNASVTLLAERGDVLVEDGSEVLAATYNGDATVRMDALGYYGDDEGWLGGNINITGDSYVTAEVINEPQPESSISLDEVSSYSGNGNAKVDLFTNNYDGLGCVGISSETPHGTITVDNSTVTALVEGDGTAKVNLDYYAETEGFVYDWTYIGANINVLGGSELSAEVKGSGDAEVNLSDHFDDSYYYNGNYTNYYNFNGGDVNIDSSSLKSTVGGSGNAFVNIGRNSWYFGYYQQNSGDVTINNSELSASLARGISSNYYYDGATVNVSGSNVDISQSSLTATQSDASGFGDARVWVNAFGQYDNESNITLDDVDISSIVAGYGEAYSYIFAYDYNNNYQNNSGNLEVLESTISAASGSDITSTAYHYAYVSLQGYGNGVNSGSVLIDHSTVTTDVKGSGYSQINSGSENYNNSETNSGDTLISNSTITATIQAPNNNNYENYAQISLWSEGSNNTLTNPQLLTIDNSTVTAHWIGDSSDQNYWYWGASVYLQSYNNYYTNSAVNINNSTINSIVDGGDRPSLFYIGSGNVNILDSQVNAIQGGTSYGDGDIFANNGSILDNAGTLISAGRLAMTATNDIGTQDSPINTQVDMLVADSSGPGSIYINEKDDLEVGINNYDYYYWYYSGHDVRANDGIISIVTGGDMLVNTINAPNGGVYLQTKEGSIYAGQPYDSDYNVTAGGASYFSALNGTIGVGYPGEDKDPAISGQIQGIVSPGVAANTGVDPSPDIDLSKGNPPGAVYYQDTGDVQTPDIVELDLLEQPVEPTNVGQEIWPVPGSISMDNPLKVNIQVQEGAPSVIPASAVPAFGGPVGLMLQFGHRANGGDPSQLANLLAGNFRKYFEILNDYRYVPIDPANPLGFYAYHPLTQADTSAYDGLALDTGAYDFIDGNLNYNGNFDPYFENGKKKK